MTNSVRKSRDIWSRRLLGIAEPVLASTPLLNPTGEPQATEFIRSFADELGHRRTVDPFVLAALLGVRPPGSVSRAADVRAWADLAAGEAPAAVNEETAGPLAYGQDAGIEIETEVELAVLHAVWRRGVLADSARLRQRAIAAARWAMSRLQPDNATGHPWAVAVFIELWLAGDDLEARHYAETLIHNSLVTNGRPDRFSAVLLLDAARLIEAAGRRGGC